ncbi:MAG TPA: bacteriohemerythrin [Candidatus Kapabacteria bacterium]|nr:bacteriohemerythrin [Candidatus Kapabacteria bacterium]HPP38914.1 bacteriohemerythrin [Candidatus Kapabacteria bacterium]
MAFINWNDSLKVNVDAIDIQYQKLVDIVNNLFDAMSEGKGNDVLNDVFNGLLNYTVEHFATEEKLMEQHNYPKAEFHKVEHSDLTRQAKELYEKFKSGQATISVPTLNFLRSWLNNHILSSDKQFGEFLNSVGVK